LSSGISNLFRSVVGWTTMSMLEQFPLRQQFLHRLFREIRRHLRREIRCHLHLRTVTGQPAGQSINLCVVLELLILSNLEINRRIKLIIVKRRHHALGLTSLNVPIHLQEKGCVSDPGEGMLIITDPVGVR
jgi:hypothetical protein